MASGKGGKSDPAKLGKKSNLAQPARKVFKTSQAKLIIKRETRMRCAVSAANALTDCVTYLLTEVLDGANDMAVHEQKKKLQPKHVNLSINKDYELRYLGKRWLIKSGGATGYLMKEDEEKKKEKVK